MTAAEKARARKAVEDAARNLAAFEGSRAFSPYLPDSPERVHARVVYRERARALLAEADAYKVCRSIARMAEDAVPGSVAEQAARVAHAAAVAAVAAARLAPAVSRG